MRTGRRARRLRWTVVLLAAAIVLGGGALAWVYRVGRPAPYRPGDRDSDITRSLARELPADAPGPRFYDVTDEAGLDGFVHFVGARTSQLPEDMGSGAAWGDYDNDGDPDLFLVSAGGSLALPPEQWARSELYENLGDARFRRVADFPETRISGMGAAWGDYDGDGRLDLVVTGYESLMLFRNLPGGFVRDERLPDVPGYWAGASWGDYDRDGDLDLYVCGYVQYVEDDAATARATMQYGRSVPFTLNPSSYEPHGNLLFRNEAGEAFTEVAEDLGVRNDAGRSLGAMWLDLDDDGWLDLYIANDISDNMFFRNVEGRFEEISHSAWVADYRGAMGLAAGDWNRDGDDDLFITHWIAQENALYDSALNNTPKDASEAQRGGAVPGLRFVDVADQRGLGQVALRLVGWGTEFADLDHDGWPDLIVSNGSTFETEESPPGLQAQKPLLLWNQAGAYFHNLAPLSDTLSEPAVGRGLALADYDDDGDLDVLFVHHGSGVQLLRNDMASGNWIKFRLRNRVAGAGEATGFGDGTKIVLELDDGPMRRAVSSASYLSQSSRVVHFGLGSAESVPTIRVRWPDGTSAAYEDLRAGNTWELTQGSPTPRPVGERSMTGAVEASGPSKLSAELDREQVVEFWAKQRAAMDALKKRDDCREAIGLFRQALALNPDHEDSLYYLANCLAATGDVDTAMERLEQLVRLSPSSHRGLKRLGTLRALLAASPRELDPARELLERALAVNLEETGSLLVLGEVALLQGDDDEATRRLKLACRTNPRAVGGFFLQGYVAWKRGDSERSRELLRRATQARGEDWIPEGMTAEGDVQRKMHSESSPLASFWESWNGTQDPGAAFAELDAHLERFGAS